MGERGRGRDHFNRNKGDFILIKIEGISLPRDSDSSCPKQHFSMLKVSDELVYNRTKESYKASNTFTTWS